MLYKCTKVQHKPINIQVKDPNSKEQRNQVCYGLAHRTVSGAPGMYRAEPATLGFQKAHSAIIHRTVQCATGLSGAPAQQQLTRATVDSAKATVCNSARQKSEQKSEAH
jgi:hypothetical protein